MGKTQGIVLRTVRYGDDRLIVDIYTEDRGIVPFGVRVPRSRRSAMHTVLLRPLSIIDMDYDYRPRVQLQRLRDMHLGVSYGTLLFHPVKETLAMFLGEFLQQALRNEGENPSLYRYLVHSLVWLDEAREGYANFHLTFLLRLTQFLGFWPTPGPYQVGQYYDMEGCQFTSIPPCHGAYLVPAEAALVPLFLRMNYATMHLYRMTRQQRARVLEVLLLYYQLHIPEFRELRSVDVLRQVLS